MKRGDIILVPFPFTDLTGNKLRPALVLISGNDDVTVAFITTQVRWKEPNDVVELVIPLSLLSGGGLFLRFCCKMVCEVKDESI